MISEKKTAIHSVKVLIVDDESDILDLLEYNFEQEGYNVLRAMNGEEALQVAAQERPDLIVLDIMMPKMDGVSACLALKSMPGLEDVCVVFLTARSEEYSEVAGFEAGADDYIFKPIKPRVLKSRIKAILRRHQQRAIVQDSNLIRIHDLEIVRDEYVVRKEKDTIPLPRKEFELFSFLASRPGKVYSREDLLVRIWENVHVTDRTVDVHVRKLREKIGARYILTVKGVGYKFLPQGSL
ncbi:response regulator transcription factor [Pontibacter sp. G13]|uniref:response regulator transcription factor n=1 Tax=Pontibacter sp. G13 TaxID=3074898 RepID=UPI00288B0FF3|nr:response regulator transcription factor [Pontibacter sp. G13]WNJ17302.1 response regulator transcription factor [Pontibacter sp. G13]